jgi:hypothetical protein
MTTGIVVLLVYVAATLCMAGVNWFLQVVHHPLYDRVGREGFAIYEAAYNLCGSNCPSPIRRGWRCARW